MNMPIAMLTQLSRFTVRVSAPLSLVAVLAGALLFAAPAPAQNDDDQTEQSESQDADAQDEQETQDEEKSGDSLDDLLDIESDETTRAHETAEQQRDAELQRALLEQRIEDNFEQALLLMGDATELLGEKFDAGLATQRVQEEILRKLEDLINSAQQQQQSSQSSSSQQQQQQQQQQQPRRQQQNQQGNNEDQQNQQSNQPLQSEATTVQNPPDQAATVSQLLDETRTEWGNLPERERELLMQALQQRTSALYRRLTSDYYKRLAESD